jgi:hypothetical protein
MSVGEAGDVVVADDGAAARPVESVFAAEAEESRREQPSIVLPRITPMGRAKCVSRMYTLAL